MFSVPIAHGDVSYIIHILIDPFKHTTSGISFYLQAPLGETYLVPDAMFTLCNQTECETNDRQNAATY